MSFAPKSEGKFCPQALTSLLAAIILFLCLGCELATKERLRPKSNKKAQAEAPSEAIKNAKQKLAAETSLTGDQKTIEELRENIPETKRADNDLLRETLGMMGEVKLPPRRHRDRFNKIIRKLRNDRRKKTRKERDKFTKKERKDREAFSKRIQKERDAFRGEKVEREERKEFYAKQDEERKEFYGNQRDRRKEFDSAAREESSDFRAYLKDRQTEFNYEYRIYQKKYREWQKSIKDQREAERRARRQLSQPKSPQGYEPLKTEE